MSMGIGRGLRMIAGLVVAGLAFNPGLAFGLQVQGVQYPAWVDLDGARKALAPGAELEANARVTTGAGGKVWLEMEDGALVKLGEEAAFRVQQVQSHASPIETRAGAEPEKGALEAAFEMLEGAFRYTTGKLADDWTRRIDIQLANTATVGIRGTDLWGQVGADEQFVVLLEGKISVQPQAGEEKVLTEPLQIYRASTAAVSTVDMPAVKKLAPETELDFGSGVMTEEGEFVVHLASFRARADAEQLQKRLSAYGLASEVSSVEVSGARWYRVSAHHLASKDDAEALASKAAKEFGLGSPWVGLE